MLQSTESLVGHRMNLPQVVTLSAVMLLAVLQCISSVEAVALGVNRASLSYTDVLRGGYAEDVVVVTTDSSVPIGGEVNMTGDFASWFNFSAREFNFSTTEPYHLRVIVEPPADTQPGTYDVDLRILTSEISRSGTGRIGTSTRASFRIPIRVVVTGTERRACTVGGIEVLDTETGQPLQLRMSVLNRGNVRIDPNITVELYDQLRSNLLQTRVLAFGSRVLPTVTESLMQEMAVALSPAQYWAVIKVPACDYNGVFTFDVLEPGGIKDDGDFIRIDAPSWVKTGDIVPINAIFRNRGARGVRAVFKGTIARVEDGEIVKVITTDEYLVQPGQTAELPTFFNPLEGGQYIVQGRVFYNGKLTIEHNTLINVNGSRIGGSSLLSTTSIIALLVIIAVILLLLILIRRRRRTNY